LVLLLDYCRFDFIKILRQHRQMIYYCTRLAQAESVEREMVEKEMLSRPELKKILDLLQEVGSDDIVTVSY
jgi:pre-mRNA-splicing helicase BRR2